MAEEALRFYDRVLYVKRLDATHVKMAVQSGDYKAHGVFPLTEAMRLFEGLRTALEAEPGGDVLPFDHQAASDDG